MCCQRDVKPDLHLAVCNSIHILILPSKADGGGGGARQMGGAPGEKGLTMLSEGSSADQMTSLDHQCDLGASISHLDVRTVVG